jgi:6-pyruvoyltetrahydropterin/6-carboxytetrahydropterin synthase
MFEVSVQETFAAAHNLRGYKGKCERLHGHNYRVEVTVTGDKLNDLGLLADFVDIKRALRDTMAKVDHVYLNEIPPFDSVNPSAENLAYFFWKQVQAGLGDQVRVSQVRVWETDNSVATYRP